MFTNTKVEDKKVFLEAAKAARNEREKDRKCNQSAIKIQVCN